MIRWSDQVRPVAVRLNPGPRLFGRAFSRPERTRLTPGPVVLDHVDCDPAEAAVSYCRQPGGPGGAWTPDCAPNIGGPN